MKDTMTIPTYLEQRWTAGSALTNAALILSATALLAISAQIAIPIRPVPMTLQPLAVLLLGAILGKSRGAAAATLYLLEGFSGLPVFANGSGGPAVFAGPTAGYLLAFPLAAWVVGSLSERGWTRSVPLTCLAMAPGIAVIHLGGWSWLSTAMGLGASNAFLVGVAPFWISDLLKISIAATLLPLVQHLIGRGSR